MAWQCTSCSETVEAIRADCWFSKKVTERYASKRLSLFSQKRVRVEISNLDRNNNRIDRHRLESGRELENRKWVVVLGTLEIGIGRPRICLLFWWWRPCVTLSFALVVGALCYLFTLCSRLDLHHENHYGPTHIDSSEGVIKFFATGPQPTPHLHANTGNN